MPASQTETHPALRHVMTAIELLKGLQYSDGALLDVLRELWAAEREILRALWAQEKEPKP